MVVLSMVVVDDVRSSGQQQGAAYIDGYQAHACSRLREDALLSGLTCKTLPCTCLCVFASHQQGITSAWGLVSAIVSAQCVDGDCDSYSQHFVSHMTGSDTNSLVCVACRSL